MHTESLYTNGDRVGVDDFRREGVEGVGEGGVGIEDRSRRRWR